MRETYLDKRHDDADEIWIWLTAFLVALVVLPIYLGYRLGLWLFGNVAGATGDEQPRPDPVHYKNPVHYKKEHKVTERPM